MFTLRPVVEITASPKEFWCPLPPKPWPDFVELSGSSTDGEVALVLLQLATYNKRESGPPFTPAELLGAERLILPGGLRASSDTLAITPSCCCGLEDWAEWRHAVTDGSSPWMGHDPSPLLEQHDDGFCMWPDEDASPRQIESAIRFTKAELEEAFNEVPERLRGFVIRLRHVLGTSAPPEADLLTAAFERTFVDTDANGHDANEA